MTRDCLPVAAMADAGFYNLNLALPADREVALRLRGLKIDQETLENRLAEYHAAPRKGGKRDVIQRVWRNAVHVTGSSTPFTFSHDWNASVLLCPCRLSVLPPPALPLCII